MLDVVRASTVLPEPVRWLWSDRIPLGEVTILGGSAGQAKSLTTIYLAAQVSRGTLTGERHGMRDMVLMFSAEDNISSTIRPRLEVAGAELENVHLVADDGLLLPDDAAHLEGHVRRHLTKLVVLDPIGGMMSGDSYKAKEVRQALAPLRALAVEHDCAVVVVMHPNKGSSSDPLTRLADSGAFGQFARCVLIQGADPADPEGDRGKQKVVAVGKANLSPPGNHSLALSIEAVPMLFPNGEQRDVPRIVVDGQHDISARDLLSSVEELTEQDACKEFLKEALEKGPRLSKEVEKEALEANFTKGTLKRARQNLIRSYKEQGVSNGPWWWELLAAPPSRGGSANESEREGDTPPKYDLLRPLPVVEPNEGVEEVEGVQGERASTGHPPAHSERPNPHVEEVVCRCEGWTAQRGDGSCASCGLRHRHGEAS